MYFFSPLDSEEVKPAEECLQQELLSQHFPQCSDRWIWGRWLTNNSWKAKSIYSQRGRTFYTPCFCGAGLVELTSSSWFWLLLIHQTVKSNERSCWKLNLTEQFLLLPKEVCRVGNWYTYHLEIQKLYLTCLNTFLCKGKLIKIYLIKPPFVFHYFPNHGAIMKCFWKSELLISCSARCQMFKHYPRSDFFIKHTTRKLSELWGDPCMPQLGSIYYYFATITILTFDKAYLWTYFLRSSFYYHFLSFFKICKFLPICLIIKEIKSLKKKKGILKCFPPC